MSIIFGIINRHEVPVAKGLMDIAYNSVKLFPQDNKSLWINKNVGLGWIQLYDTPESVYDKQPICWADRYTLIGKARLDNREELCHVFNIKETERNQIPDTFLLKLSYEKWGNDCAEKLFGDWAFALWDEVEKKMFLARDHYGITALYYTISEHFFAFSTNLHVLLALPSVSRELNMDLMAQLLVAWNGTPETTIYKNIFRIPPSNTAVYFNNKIQQKQYWRIEEVQEVRFKNDQDYVDACHELFTNAVKNRIRSYRPVSSALSSGLDSSSVTAFAATLLDKESKRINAYTHVPVFDTTGIYKSSVYGNEGPLAGLVAKRFSNMDHVLVDSLNRDPMKGILDSMEIFCSPNRNASNQYWIISILEMASNNGMGTLLTGQCGNITISWPFRRDFLRTLNKGFGENLREHIPDNLWRFLFKLKTSQPLLHLSMIKPDFAKEIKLLQKMEKTGYQFNYNRSKSFKQIRYYTINTIMSKTGALWQESGDYFGLNIYDPTIDIKLLEFCAGIPDDQFVRPDNDRYLIRRLMKNKLPQEILENKKKGKQSSDVILRLKDSFEQYSEMAEKMKESSLCCSVIDLNKMISELNQLNRNNSKINVKMESGLLRGFNMGAFLLKKEIENS